MTYCFAIWGEKYLEMGTWGNNLGNGRMDPLTKNQVKQKLNPALTVFWDTDKAIQMKQNSRVAATLAANHNNGKKKGKRNQ